jgi:PmbA/TldA metallopeptidase domain 1
VRRNISIASRSESGQGFAERLQFVHLLLQAGLAGRLVIGRGCGVPERGSISHESSAAMIGNPRYDSRADGASPAQDHRRLRAIGQAYGARSARVWQAAWQVVWQVVWQAVRGRYDDCLAIPAPRGRPRPPVMPDLPHGFTYRSAQFQQIVDDALALARQLGASDAGVEVSEGAGLSVSVRKGELENVERNRDKSVGVSVYLGQRRGNASTSDFSRAAVEQTVRAAYDIARFTAEDPAAGLPDEADIASREEAGRDLDLFHPWAIDAAQAAEIAHRCEQAALGTDRRLRNW